MGIKNSFQKLTTLGRLCVIILLVAIVGGGVWFGAKKLGKGDGKMFSFSKDDADSYDAVLLVDTYTGWSPIV